MAEVATVYSIDTWPRTIGDVLHGVHDNQEMAQRRPRPVNKRVWASIVHAPQRVIQDAFDEAMRRDPELRRRWVVLVDGNKDQLDRIKQAARITGVKITIVLDIVHVLEYLWRAAYAFHPDGTKEAQEWVECRLLALLSGRSGGEIAKGLRAMIKTHHLDEKATERVEATATYLTNNTRLMHYDRALAEGLPISTGVIEGACRYLVQDRMAVPVRCGRLRAPKLCSVSAHSVQVMTSTTTGNSTSRRNTSARTSHATPTATSPTRFRPNGHTSGSSSDRSSFRRRAS
jgi:hypothetical protein